MISLDHPFWYIENIWEWSLSKKPTDMDIVDRVGTPAMFGN